MLLSCGDTMKRPFPSMRTAPKKPRKRPKPSSLIPTLIDFSDDDFVCGEADITECSEDGCEENADGDGGLENENCSECPYFCPVCKECMYEDECED